MNILSRTFAPILTAAALLGAPAAQAGPPPDPLLSGFAAGLAVGAIATTVLAPPPPVYVYPAPSYWAPEPPPPYPYPASAWQEHPGYCYGYGDDDDDGDPCDE